MKNIFQSKLLVPVLVGVLIGIVAQSVFSDFYPMKDYGTLHIIVTLCIAIVTLIIVFYLHKKHPEL